MPCPFGVGVLALLFFVWCALGLRSNAAGDASDHYVDDDSCDWKELVSGNFVNQVQRESRAIVSLNVLGCA
ncbi:MAG: hypothetical protein U0746_13890 [Gemmataceae bacterium]